VLPPSPMNSVPSGANSIFVGTDRPTMTASTV